MNTVYKKMKRIRGPNKKSASRYKGVHWHARTGYWQVKLNLDGKQKYVGCSKDELLAALIYDKAAREHYGDTVYLNFPKCISPTK